LAAVTFREFPGAGGATDTRMGANMNSSAIRKKAIQAGLRLQALAGKERY